MNQHRNGSSGGDGAEPPPPFLKQKTVTGLHEFIVTKALQRFSPMAGPALDLGAGSGALAARLQNLGWDVQAADMNASEFRADVPFLKLDLNQPDFASRLGERTFGLVTSLEVIEHLENPTGFLRNVARLLKPDGIAVLSTPNVDNAAARMKFLFTDRVWMVSRFTPEHLTPIFYDLMVHHYLPRAGLRLDTYIVYPDRNFIPEDFLLTRSWLIPFFKAALIPFRGATLLGNSHIFIASHVP
jgi:SAM-dependent methyltransferase